MEINRVSAKGINEEHYELVVVGSGFGSGFFLTEALKHLTGRALILEMRNLVVVGTATYPSCSPANPSLTAAALSIRAADLLYS
ncbi:hypothetical protein [Stutzerimonas stutzeri]|uniref:hypothetical protein n=1 Tax=Stutzerimonas stutzeri TaxID=316 RepID=UPI00210969FF|nr:hypothetical protein [Stutzerimonas stutzeri]MCQ4319275.1 hypothetical protein [Stutzerimonas stutzeri]